MDEHVQVVEFINVERNEEEIINKKRKEQSLRARYAYGFIFFATNILAWFLRDFGNIVLHELHYFRICRKNEEDCFHSKGVLRIFFSFMFFTTLRTRKLNQIRNSWHSNWWILKLVLYLVSIVVTFLIPDVYIHIYGEIARIGAGTFLLLQLMSVIQFITWCNANWMPDLQPEQCGLIGLFFATISYIASYSGIIAMYFMYATEISCTFNIFFITWTAILVNVLMIVSLHSKVNRGLLSSGIMSSYIVFLCWSTIQSEPPNDKCKTQKWISDNGDWTTVLGFLVAVFAIVMATFSTGIDSKSFQEVEVESDDEIPYRYEVFHFIFSIGAMYFAMLFISWELDHTTKRWSIDVGWISTWVKFINESFAVSLFRKPLLKKIKRSTNANFIELQSMSSMDHHHHVHADIDGTINAGTTMFVHHVRNNQNCRNISMNSNIQGMTNSVFFWSELIMRDPGTRLNMKQLPIHEKMQFVIRLEFILFWFAFLCFILLLFLFVWKFVTVW